MIQAYGVTTTHRSLTGSDILYIQLHWSLYSACSESCVTLVNLSTDIRPSPTAVLGPRSCTTHTRRIEHCYASMDYRSSFELDAAYPIRSLAKPVQRHIMDTCRHSDRRYCETQCDPMAFSLHFTFTEQYILYMHVQTQTQTLPPSLKQSLDLSSVPVYSVSPESLNPVSVTVLMVVYSTKP